MKKALVRLFGVVLLASLAGSALLAQTTGSIRGVVETGATALARRDRRGQEPEPPGHPDRGDRRAGALHPDAASAGQVHDHRDPRRVRGQAARPCSSRSAQSAITDPRAHPGEDGGRHRHRGGRRRLDRLDRRSGATSTRRSSRRSPPDATTPASRSSTPGVGTDNSDSRNTSITVYGSTGLENSYMVDGANTTGVEFGSQGKTLNFEFIQEVEFKAGGYEAEYGGAPAASSTS